MQGVWFNRGLGSHALSQPAREFVVKTIEMGLYSADFIACHSEFHLLSILFLHWYVSILVLLLFLTIPTIIPYFDRLHATMLFWLAPNQQIRPPIYSFRQRSQRRKIVFKCEWLLSCWNAFLLPRSRSSSYLCSSFPLESHQATQLWEANLKSRDVCSTPIMEQGWPLSSDTIVYIIIQAALVALIVLPIIFKNVLNLTPSSVPFGAII
jgi:hypothetical protein